MKTLKFSDYYEIISWELCSAIARYNESWEWILCSEEHERSRYLNGVEQHRLTVIILTCAFLEALINFYLCTKCNAIEFNELDRGPREKRCGFKDKWKKAPKRFVANYTLDTEQDLLTDLDDVVERRDAIVHSKPMISIDGDNRHAGNAPPFELNEHEFMARCASLPFRLVDRLQKFDPDTLFLDSMLRLCGRVNHKFKAGQYFIERCSNASEELIKEIMTQGYDRHTAKHYAVRIGDSPRWSRDGAIVVSRRKEELARLKPLNFFAHQKWKLFVDGGAE